MPGLLRTPKKPAQRSVRDDVRAVLRQAGAERSSEQGAGIRSDGRNNPSAGKARARRNLELRQAEIGETPLSPSEIRFGIARGLIAGMPVGPVCARRANLMPLAARRSGSVTPGPAYRRNASRQELAQLELFESIGA